MKISNKRIENSIITLLTDSSINYQYFGEFLMYVNFIETTDIKTAGVNVSATGMNFYFNENFINDLSETELGFIILHEVLHLQFRHNFRIGIRDKKLSNIAMDMIINTIIKNEAPTSYATTPTKIQPYFIPKEYTGKLIYEDVYEFLKNNEDKNGEGNGEGNEKGNGKDQLVDHHFDNDDISDEHANSIIQDVKQAIQNKGIKTNNAESLLNKIETPKKDYIKEIKKHASSFRGSIKVRTISKQSRRGTIGTKGNKKVGTEIVVLLDTSGSMMGSFEKILTAINQNGMISHVILCDTEIKDIITINSKASLSKLKIKGLGGTELQPGINYYNTSKFSSLPLLILTDGYCDSLNLSKNKSKSMIITVGVNVNIIGTNTNIKQIKL